MMLIRKWKKPRSLLITKQEMNVYVSSKARSDKCVKFFLK